MSKRTKLLIIILVLILFSGFTWHIEGFISIFVGCSLFYWILTRPSTSYHRRQTFIICLSALAIFFIIYGLINMAWVGLLVIIIGAMLIMSPTKTQSVENVQILNERDTLQNSQNQEANKSLFLKWQYFFGSQPAPQHLDDFSLVSGIQSTLLDFGQVLIPRGEHFLVIQKIGGQLKLVIPEGVGVALHVHQYRGRVYWNQQEEIFNNQQMILTTKQFAEAPRQLNIHLYMGIGDIRVIEL